MAGQQFGMDYMLLLLLWLIIPILITTLQGLRAKYRAWIEARRLKEIESSP